MTAPVPPPDRLLAQIEAQTAVLGLGDPPPCRHCRAHWQPISSWPGSRVVRAAELRHEDGCPALDD